MSKIFFDLLSEEAIPDSSVIDISEGGKILILSDLHMGTGQRDDLFHNGKMLACLLEEYYFKNGWVLVLNGDIEELMKYPLEKIMKNWECLYGVFDLFHKENRLFKIIGNHDEKLVSRKYASYPYPLHSALKINTQAICAYVYHGHQFSNIYRRFGKLMGMGNRYILKPFGIKNISAARNPRRRFHIEKEAYVFSMANNCLSVIGHTHRPLFESLGRFDYIKFEIERLCQIYPSVKDGEKERIENEVANLRAELGKLKRKERRDVLRQSLYGDVLPVPCLFNSGSTLDKKGLNAIEITSNDISLIYWFEEGKSKKFIKRGGYRIDTIPGTPYCRSVLNNSKLDYISAKIKLLG